LIIKHWKSFSGAYWLLEHVCVIFFIFFWYVIFIYVNA
jgi:hypothetical protein